MPQNSQIIGVNSVTNIELDKGVMPAPIIRNADWFEKRNPLRITDRVLLPYRGCLKTPEGACYADSIIVPYLYRIVAIGRFTSVNVGWGRIQDGWQADIFDGAFRIRQGQSHRGC